jgi:hypothetical protein
MTALDGASVVRHSNHHLFEVRFPLHFQAAETRDRAGKTYPQGLKPNIFSIVYGPTKVVP